MKAAELIALFERMARERWAYEWGAAKEGCVDCSGAFVYAFRELDGPKIEHGSNSIARKRVSELRPISEAQPGWAAFKVRAWTDDEIGNKWYGSAPGNAYHMGLVGSDGKIYHAKGEQSGFVVSDTKGWTHTAPLLAVEYGSTGVTDAQGECVLYHAIVSTQTDPLTLRESPNGTRIGKIPKGSTVEVLGESNGWMRVRCGGLLGWVSGQYLIKTDDTEGVTLQIVIRDEAGREFRPVGVCTMDVEVVTDSID